MSEDKLYNPLWKLPSNILFYLGAFITLFGLIGFASSEDDQTYSRLYTVLYAGVLPMIIGFIGKEIIKRNTKRINRSRSLRNLKILLEENDELSIAFVSERLNTPIEESKKLLERLIKDGLLEAHVNESGVMMYRTPDKQF